MPSCSSSLALLRLVHCLGLPLSLCHAKDNACMCSCHLSKCPGSTMQSRTPFQFVPRCCKTRTDPGSTLSGHAALSRTNPIPETPDVELLPYKTTGLLDDLTNLCLQHHHQTTRRADGALAATLTPASPRLPPPAPAAPAHPPTPLSCAVPRTAWRCRRGSWNASDISKKGLNE